MGFAFKMPDDHKDAMAATSANFEGRSAIIYMAPELDGDEEEAYAKYELIRESARHEALELLLMPMQKGYNIARRTVAKYREILNIAPTNLRKIL